MRGLGPDRVRWAARQDRKSQRPAHDNERHTNVQESIEIHEVRARNFLVKADGAADRWDQLHRKSDAHFGPAIGGPKDAIDGARSSIDGDLVHDEEQRRQDERHN
jgi:hypothetical protein